MGMSKISQSGFQGGWWMHGQRCATWAALGTWLSMLTHAWGHGYAAMGPHVNNVAQPLGHRCAVTWHHIWTWVATWYGQGNQIRIGWICKRRMKWWDPEKNLWNFHCASSSIPDISSWMSQNGLKWSLKVGERGGDGSQGSCGVLARLIPYGLTNLGSPS